MGFLADPYGEPDGPGGGWGSLSPDERVSLLAGRRHGVLSTAQLRECGLTSQAIYRRLQKRRLIRLYPNVYAVGQLALSSGWRDQAAVLACGPYALLSHRSAAHLWAIRRTSSTRIEVTAPRARRGPDAITVHRSRLIHPEDRALVSSIPVTSVARTLVDLADVLTLPALQRAINEAELLGLFDLAALDRTLARLPNRRGEGDFARPFASIARTPLSRAAAASAAFCGSARTTAYPSPRRTCPSPGTRWISYGPTPG